MGLPAIPTTLTKSQLGQLALAPAPARPVTMEIVPVLLLNGKPLSVK
jgi:hypothetical protein